MTMQITRRNALLGATAAAAVTGLTAVPLAMKAAGVKAALSSTSDAQIVALAEEHDRVFSEMDKAGDCWYEAVMAMLPPHLRQVSLLDHKNSWQMVVWRVVLKTCEYPKLKTLRAEEDRLRERCDELTGRLSQTEATTLQGVCTKFRVTMGPAHRSGCNLIDSAVADLGRLAGEMRS